MACDYECLKKYSKIFSLLGAALMIFLSMGKFFGLMKGLNVIDYIISVYLL
jgi:hypothetical protein